MRVARYGAVSVMSIVTTQLLLQAFARSGMGAEQANATAVLLAALPAFVLSRTWIWNDRRDTTPVRRQAATFWTTVLVGLTASTLVVTVADRSTNDSLVIGAASFATFGALWAGRFVVLDRIAFGHGRRFGAVGRWLDERRADLVVLVPVLILVTVVHAWGMDSYPARFDDEGTYVAEAWAVMNDGALSQYTYWYDHPPVGWIQLVPWLWLGDGLDRAPSAVAAGREFMLAVQVVSSVLLYAWARRLGIGRAFAASAVILFTLSPLALHWHRQVLLDNLAIMWLLAAFALAVTPGRRLAAYAGSGACFAVSVLSKETMLLLLPALGYQLWRGCDPRTRRYCLAVAGSLFAAILAFYPLFALLQGELLPGQGHVSLWQGIMFQLVDRQGSGSVFEQGTNAHQVVSSWLHLDPWLLGAGAVLSPIAALVRHLRPAALALIGSIAIIARPGYLPVPYLIVLLPLAALVIAGTADSLWKLAARRRGASRRRRIAWSAAVRVPAAATLAVIAAVALGRVGPAWAAELEDEITAPADAPTRAAESWVRANVDRNDTILVDNTMWLDLLDAGFQRRKVIWFYKLDHDPGVGEAFPGGWRDFDYVISSEAVRATTYTVPSVEAALAHSRVVATFGSGTTRIEIRRIEEERHGADRDRPDP